MADEWDAISRDVKPGINKSGAQTGAQTLIMDDGSTKPVDPWDAVSKGVTNKKTTAAEPSYANEENEQSLWGRAKNRTSEMGAILQNMGQGVPIARNYLPFNEDAQIYKEENPKSATGLNVAGGVLSTLPAGVAMSGLKLVPQVVAGSGIGGMLGFGDSATDSNKSWGDVWDDTKSGAKWGALGPLLGKMLSPGKPAAAMPTEQLSKVIPKGRVIQGMGSKNQPSGEVVDQLADIAKSAGKSSRDKLAESSLPSWFNDANVKRMSSAALGAGGMMGMGPFGITAALLPYLPDAAKAGVKAAKKYPNSNWASKGDVSPKDLVRALTLYKASHTDSDGRDTN